MTTIDSRLNLVIPVDTDRGTLHVHATPIGTPTFEKHYKVLARTFTEIYAGGLGMMAGPRVAMLALRDTAAEMGDKVAMAVQTDLIPEIHRRTMVVGPGAADFTTFDDAVARNLINDEDRAEIDNALAFFTVNSAMHKRAVANEINESAGAIWGAQTSSLGAMEFAASLSKSTVPANTGVTSPPPAPSSAPATESASSPMDIPLSSIPS